MAAKKHRHPRFRTTWIATSPAASCDDGFCCHLKKTYGHLIVTVKKLIGKMIEQYLNNHYNINRLYGSYLINSDDNDLALQEVKNFIQANILSNGELDRNPDYMCVQKLDSTSKNISVDQIRNLQGFLHTTSVISGKKVAVIYAADKMNVNAANCCLKILEEPSANAHLFLITENAASLLPTIISRCMKINHHYVVSSKHNIDERFVLPLLRSIPVAEKLSFMKEFAEKDRDLWIEFSSSCTKLLAKFCQKIMGLEVELSDLERAVLLQFRSNSLPYLQIKYEDVQKMIDEVNEFDLDLRASCVLLIDKFSK
jgi:DNA polymerase-3 subunit delta'